MRKARKKLTPEQIELVNRWIKQGAKWQQHWAGGGIRGGRSIGITDDFSYNVVSDPVKIVDINNTVMHCLGIDNKRLSVKFQGLDARATGVDTYRLLKELL